MRYILLLALIACTPPPKKVNPAILLLLVEQPTQPTEIDRTNSQYCARCYGDTGLPIKDDPEAKK